MYERLGKSIVLEVASFCFLLSFAFCYDLDLWAEGQAMRSFFHWKKVLP